MSRDDITRMAREAGLTVCRDEWVFGAMLERFAELVRADEREACAKVCEPQEEHDDPLTAWKIAAAIRARSNT
ncbi:hypothetical protein [Phage DSL-LC05]|nr:hypothetical protein [Phage DSL-LC05]